MTTTTLLFERVGLLALLVHDERDPSAADWSQWVQFYATATREHNVRDLLVLSRGGGPNSRQRTEVVNALVGCLGPGAMRLRTAVCTDSRLARGITTAIGWLYPMRHLRSFGHDQEQRNLALDFLQVAPGLRPAVLSTAERMEHELLRMAHADRVRRPAQS